MATTGYDYAPIAAAPQNSRPIVVPPLGPQRRFWLIVLTIWSLLAIISAGQTALYLVHAGAPVPWRSLLVGRLANWYTCALFLPPLVWLARRFPIERTNWRRTVPLTFIVSLGCAVAKCIVYLPVDHLLGARTATLASLLVSDLTGELTIFWAALGVIHAVEFYRRYQTRAAYAMRLEGELAGARLDALASRLRPHFLFNTLGAISELTHKDPDGADRMLTQLADLLRETLRRPSDSDIPLAEEMALIDRYVSIMRVRFGSRLTVTVESTDRSREALVPAFVLQPLVENAFEHGIGRRPGPGHVLIRASVENGDADTLELRLVVEDDGVGLGDHPEEGGLGIASTRQRLARRYGDGHRFLLRRTPGGGTRASIAIPFVRDAGMVADMPMTAAGTIRASASR